MARGIHHIGVTVRDLEARLAALGVAPWPPGAQRNFSGGRAAFLPGPDGEEIELIEPGQ